MYSREHVDQIALQISFDRFLISWSGLAHYLYGKDWSIDLELGEWDLVLVADTDTRVEILTLEGEEVVMELGAGDGM